MAAQKVIFRLCSPVVPLIQLGSKFWLSKVVVDIDTFLRDFAIENPSSRVRDICKNFFWNLDFINLDHHIRVFGLIVSKLTPNMDGNLGQNYQLKKRRGAMASWRRDVIIVEILTIVTLDCCDHISGPIVSKLTPNMEET